jgi:hypothetical protein
MLGACNPDNLDEQAAILNQEQNLNSMTVLNSITNLKKFSLIFEKSLYFKVHSYDDLCRRSLDPENLS